jgi:ferric-dicitrate binding protein FerR (iron transport regulator)
VVTKKQRRTQLARARAQRRSESIARREARRRRNRTIAALVAALVAVGALVLWIVTHDGGSAAASAATVDYDALPAVLSTTPIEVSR